MPLRDYVARILRVNAAPADAGLVAGEVTTWFDSTNGNAKYMFKGKQADGTVVVGAVPVGALQNAVIDPYNLGYVTYSHIQWDWPEGQTWYAANRAAWKRMAAGRGGAITKIRLGIETSSGNIDVGVYANSGLLNAAVAGARKGSTGTIPAPAAGDVQVTLTASTVMSPGEWFGFTASSTTLRVVVTLVSAYVNMHIIRGMMSGNHSLGSTVLPDPAPAAGATSDRFPVMMGVA